MLYDDQAAHYDERAAIPDDAAAKTASAIDAIVDLSRHSRVLEIGVGTGLVSMHLLAYDIDYIGFDRSQAMLGVFAQKAAVLGAHPTLVVADGNEKWPAEKHSIDVVFCARALHHLAPNHVVSELNRVLSDHPAWLVVAKVSRPKDSPKSEMRRAMRQLLREHGVDGRNHERHTDDVFDRLESNGAQRIAPIIAARWTTRYRPIDSIDAWLGKEGLGGVEIDADVKLNVIEGVRTWGAAQYGTLEGEIEQEEFIELHAIQTLR
ncbi:MAG: class I SAM-dependent methyltransferase [bacterium]|nr:class I SAM-dependent methyltransferase [Candidatus Kapabacteria bacterium]